MRWSPPFLCVEIHNTQLCCFNHGRVFCGVAVSPHGGEPPQCTVFAMVLATRFVRQFRKELDRFLLEESEQFQRALRTYSSRTEKEASSRHGSKAQHVQTAAAEPFVEFLPLLERMCGTMPDFCAMWLDPLFASSDQAAVISAHVVSLKRGSPPSVLLSHSNVQDYISMGMGGATRWRIPPSCKERSGPQWQHSMQCLQELVSPFLASPDACSMHQGGGSTKKDTVTVDGGPPKAGLLLVPPNPDQEVVQLLYFRVVRLASAAGLLVTVLVPLDSLPASWLSLQLGGPPESPPSWSADCTVLPSPLLDKLNSCGKRISACFSGKWWSPAPPKGTGAPSSVSQGSGAGGGVGLPPTPPPPDTCPPSHLRARLHAYVPAAGEMAPMPPATGSPSPFRVRRHHPGGNHSWEDEEESQVIQPVRLFDHGAESPPRKGAPQRGVPPLPLPPGPPLPVSGRPPRRPSSLLRPRSAGSLLFPGGGSVNATLALTPAKGGDISTRSGPRIPLAEPFSPPQCSQDPHRRSDEGTDLWVDVRTFVHPSPRRAVRFSHDMMQSPGAKSEASDWDGSVLSLNLIDGLHIDATPRGPLSTQRTPRRPFESFEESVESLFDKKQVSTPRSAALPVTRRKQNSDR